MNIAAGTAWAFVTARGGSKSIPLKNIVPVAGKPLLHYSLDAANKAETISRVVCSTDHEKIAAAAREKGALVMDRPEHLGGDLVASVDVVIHAAKEFLAADEPAPEIIVLVQPTSIFLRAEHIDAVVKGMLAHPECGSGQAVIKVPHQFHAHNQRAMSPDGNDIYFVYPEERERGYSKQTKPVHYTYGNLIATRTKALLETSNLFARPSFPVVVPLEYAYDLDGPEDMAMAELMLREKMVELDGE
ncbi:MAG: acylneuraminate cytidylyltransferase family protein [Desulfovibrio sp.]